MSQNLKAYCIGHTMPLFVPSISYEMLCPASLGIANQLVIDDRRFGDTIDGGELAEYSQLFGLHDLLLSGDVTAEHLYLFQYRKFISTTVGGLESVSPWIRVLTPQLVSGIFPSSAQLEAFSGRLAVGSVFDFGESISSNYARVHVIDDLVMFAAACAQSGAVDPADIQSFASMRGIIPSPAVCCIHVDVFMKIMGILKAVWTSYSPHYRVPRTGYQRRVAGYLLERLHSFLLCKWLMDNSEPDIQLWQRYVVTEAS
ncbi:hypothetical protein [Rhodoferax sp.]|uniref:hypothetical protein n=1 Tax=Rhodoferax sp. TaxID=50421 RepID=UPI00374CBA10